MSVLCHTYSLPSGEMESPHKSSILYPIFTPFLTVDECCMLDTSTHRYRVTLRAPATGDRKFFITGHRNGAPFNGATPRDAWSARARSMLLAALVRARALTVREPY